MVGPGSSRSNRLYGRKESKIVSLLHICTTHAIVQQRVHVIRGIITESLTDGVIDFFSYVDVDVLGCSTASKERDKNDCSQ